MRYLLRKYSYTSAYFLADRPTTINEQKTSGQISLVNQNADFFSTKLVDSNRFV